MLAVAFNTFHQLVGVDANINPLQQIYRDVRFDRGYFNCCLLRGSVDSRLSIALLKPEYIRQILIPTDLQIYQLVSGIAGLLNCDLIFAHGQIDFKISVASGF